jgi:hypothetical protein
LEKRRKEKKKKKTERKARGKANRYNSKLKVCSIEEIEQKEGQKTSRVTNKERDCSVILRFYFFLLNFIPSSPLSAVKKKCCRQAAL